MGEPTLIDRISTMEKRLAHLEATAESGGGTHYRQVLFVVAGTLATGTNQSAEVIWDGVAGTITKVTASVKTAPTGADIICDINIGGTSIWASTQANRITIAATEKTGSGTAFDTTAVAVGNTLTLDIDQVGSTIAGAELTVLLTISCEAA